MMPGPAYAILAGLSWSVAVILFKKSGEALNPLGLNIFKNVISLALLLLTCALFVEPASMRFDADAAWVCASGILGVGVADTLFFAGLNRLGAGRTAIVDCSYSPFIVLFSVVLLSERLSLLDGLGAVLIVAAVLLAMNDRAPVANTGRMLSGVLFGLASMAVMGISVVAVKPILDRMDVVFSTTMRMLGGTFSLFIWALPSRVGREAARVAFTPARVWRFAVPAAIFGTYIAMLLWIAGFKYNDASVASILNQTSTAFTVLLATLVLKERLTPARVVAMGVAIGGSVLVLI